MTEDRPVERGFARSPSLTDQATINHLSLISPSVRVSSDDKRAGRQADESPASENQQSGGTDLSKTFLSGHRNILNNFKISK